MTAQTIRAVLLARATATTFDGFRASSVRTHSASFVVRVSHAAIATSRSGVVTCSPQQVLSGLDLPQEIFVRAPNDGRRAHTLFNT